MASPFPNDGSFLERFKQLQQDPPLETLKSTNAVSKSTLPSKSLSNVQSSNSSSQKSSLKLSVPNGKLAFSLKQKSKLAVNAIKLGEDGDDDGEVEADRRVKKARREFLPSSVSPEPKESGPPTPPGDQEVKKVADKLATFVAKNGRQFENITREKNPGDTPFRFLFDIEGAEYKYYEYRIAQEEAVLASEAAGTQSSHSGSGPRHYNSQPRQSNGGQHQRYQTPASALYSGGDDRRRPSLSSGSSQESAQERYSQSSYTNDSVAMMEFYMKKAAQEDLRKPPKQSKDEMPPPASLQPSPPRERVPSPVMWPSEEPSVPETAPPYLSPTIGVVEDAASVAAKKGHHMGDYIPPEELEKFMAKCNDAMAAKMAKATADRAKIQADNVGHRLLSKMGWKEGEGLGSGRSGRSDPVQAGEVKLNNLGVGAEQPGEVTAEDDIYEQYKKRMMLGYRFRPNPLNNPRKAYY